MIFMERHGEWDLKRLVKDKRQLDYKINELRANLDRFQVFKARLNDQIKIETFKAILGNLEKITELERLISRYGLLRYSEDTQSVENSELKTLVTRLSSEVSNKTEFFYDWWKKGIDPKNAVRLINGSGNLSYYLSHMRKMSKYYLSEPEEKIINTMSSTGISALVKLYATLTNGFEYRFKLNGKMKSMTKEEVLAIIRNSADPGTRRSAYTALLSKYHENSRILGDIYQNCALNWGDTCVGLRKYKSPISAKNIRNGLDDEVVDALLKSCRSNIGIFREFFKIKAKEIGMKKLKRYDIYAPIKAISDNKDYSYVHASKLVLDSWKKLSPRLSSHAEKVIRNGYVDYGIRKGKKSGAFCAGIIPSLSPYVSLSYNGNTESLLTLAHEIGHAVHYSAASNNSILAVRATLPLAESASAFSELLVFKDIIHGSSKVSARSMLFKKFDDYYATIMRQAYLTMFEIDAHQKIAAGATVAELNDLYYDNLKEQFGDSVNISKDFEIEWMSVPHIYNDPFYC